jgi:hypothetical protein
VYHCIRFATTSAYENRTDRESARETMQDITTDSMRGQETEDLSLFSLSEVFFSSILQLMNENVPFSISLFQKCFPLMKISLSLSLSLGSRDK